MIRHISFDLWLTLIKSNPFFKRKRAELIADNFHPKNMNVDQIEMHIRQKDKMFDRYNEMYEVKIPAKYMYFEVLQSIDSQSHDIDIDDALWLMRKSNELLMDYPPQLLNEQIPDILCNLRSEMEGFNLGSNTGYIEGEILRQVLKKIGIYDFFTFCVFSDEIQTSKPSGLFFQSIFDKASVPKSNILHIGDNRITDYQGALNFGFNALLITHSNYTLHDIKSKL
jgi:putative hydrolase of the HAD superfamily